MANVFLRGITGLKRSALQYGGRLSTAQRVLAVLPFSVQNEEVNIMAVHHGGKVGKAAKTLATKSSSPKAKSKAGKTLQAHQEAKHK